MDTPTFDTVNSPVFILNYLDCDVRDLVALYHSNPTTLVNEGSFSDLVAVIKKCEYDLNNPVIIFFFGYGKDTQYFILDESEVVPIREFAKAFGKRPIILSNTFTPEDTVTVPPVRDEKFWADTPNIHHFNCHDHSLIHIILLVLSAMNGKECICDIFLRLGAFLNRYPSSTMMESGIENGKSMKDLDIVFSPPGGSPVGFDFLISFSKLDESDTLK